MAWRCSGTTNTALITNLAEAGLIRSDRVKSAMLAVDRAHFTPSSSSPSPYSDSPQPIGHGATISAPHMHAAAASSLLPYLHPGAHVLDIGSGSGYLTAVLSHLVSPGGKVVGIDHIQALVDLANKNVGKSEWGRGRLESGEIGFVRGDGRVGKEGEEGLLWDAIHVGAAAEEGVHEVLVGQLKAPGRIFIPVASRSGQQNIWIIDKKADGRVEKKKDIGVVYVPLTDAPRE